MLSRKQLSVVYQLSMNAVRDRFRYRQLQPTVTGYTGRAGLYDLSVVHPVLSPFTRWANVAVEDVDVEEALQMKVRGYTDALPTSFSPMSEEQIQQIVKDALQAFLTDPGYIIDMAYAATHPDWDPELERDFETELDELEDEDAA